MLLLSSVCVIICLSLLLLLIQFGAHTARPGPDSPASGQKAKKPKKEKKKLARGPRLRGGSDELWRHRRRHHHILYSRAFLRTHAHSCCTVISSMTLSLKVNATPATGLLLWRCIALSWNHWFYYAWWAVISNSDAQTWCLRLVDRRRQLGQQYWVFCYIELQNSPKRNTVANFYRLC